MCVGGGGGGGRGGGRGSVKTLPGVAEGCFVQFAGGVLAAS